MFLLCAICWLIHKTSHGPWFHTLIGCISFWNYNLYHCLKCFLTKKAVAWAQLLLIQVLETLENILIQKVQATPYGSIWLWSSKFMDHPKRIALWVCTDLQPFAPGGHFGAPIHHTNKGTFERVKDGAGDGWWVFLKLWSGKFRATSAEVKPNQ